MSKEERRRLRMPAVSRISVTKDTIVNAVPCDTRRCVIHNAVQAAYPDAAVWVDGQKIRIKLKGMIHYAPTPGLAWGAITLVDSGKGDQVKPFHFNLKINSVRASQAVPEDRKRQINAARNKRAEEGRPDKKYYRIAGRQLTRQEWDNVRAKVERDIDKAA
jgi:hypothetical protein